MLHSTDRQFIDHRPATHLPGTQRPIRIESWDGMLWCAEEDEDAQVDIVIARNPAARSNRSRSKRLLSRGRRLRRESSPTPSRPRTVRVTVAQKPVRVDRARMRLDRDAGEGRAQFGDARHIIQRNRAWVEEVARVIQLDALMCASIEWRQRHGDLLRQRAGRSRSIYGVAPQIAERAGERTPRRRREKIVSARSTAPFGRRSSSISDSSARSTDRRSALGPRRLRIRAGPLPAL